MTLDELKKYMAGLNATTMKKKAAVDWNAIKGNVTWDAIKQKIQEAKAWYESMPAEQRALIGAGVGLGGGALLGKLMGRTGTGALAGTLAGAGAGAYWKDIRKAIDAAKSSKSVSEALSAVKPVVSDAAKKTKDRIDAIAKKLGVTDKKKDTPENATAKALASTGVNPTSGQVGPGEYKIEWHSYLADKLKEEEKKAREALASKGINVVVR